MKNSNSKRRLPLYGGLLGSVILMGGMFSSCQDDLLTGQPSWLGESIYAELQSRGNYSETLKLINAQTVYDKETGQRVNAGYADVLAKTGSKTLFVANDAAWKKFYENNPWGVKSMDEMSDAQKSLLFGGNMINSAYLVELLGDIPSASATEDPIKGSCMRRMSSVNAFDSVPVVSKVEFPEVNPVRVDKTTGEQVDWWSRVRDKEEIRLLQDANAPTMIHLMPSFMKSNNISNEDISFLTGGEITSNQDAVVNGSKIIEKDITCQNGYIHVLDGVVAPLPNMAQLVNTQPQFSIYNRLMERFSYPHYDAGASLEYQRLYGAPVTDSVFVKRYFNNHLSTDGKFEQTDQNVKVSTTLPYDPGWNRYVLYAAGGQITYQYDAGVMLVPTDQAMMEYLQNDGSDLNERYANAGPGATAWDNAPDEVILPLLQNTMLTSLRSAIPSQFASINNTAAESMGVQKADIDKVLWGSNGVIYQTNKVYVAPEYVSVFYPCVIRANDDLNLVYTVVSNDNKVAGGEGFYAYLNNMGVKQMNGVKSGYSFIIPTDNALQYYYDPVSYKRVDNKNASTAVAYKFFVNTNGYIAADPYDVDWTNLDAKGRGTIGSKNTTISISNSTKSDGDAFNHFKDIINSSLAVGLFKPEQKIYLSRSGNPIIVDWDGDKVAGVAGSFQYERNYFVPVVETVDKSGDGNGRSYIVDEEPLMSTMTSPYAALTSPSNGANFGTFANLLKEADLLKNNDGASHTTMDSCLTNMNNYHYTIYVPKAEKIDALIAEHKIPTGDDIDVLQNRIDAGEIAPEDEQYLTEQIAEMKLCIQNFINYHIQDNSVFIDGAEINGDKYESSCLDTTTNRFAKITVNYKHGGDLTVIDNMGNTRKVLKDNGLYNIMTRQYFFNGANLKGNTCTQIYNSSYAVIHQIDDVLVPFENCYYPKANWDKVQEILAKEPYIEEGEGEGGEPQPARKNLKR